MIMLKKLFQYNLINPLLYSAIPIFRLPVIFFIFGGDFFKNFTVISSIFLFIPEIFFISFDSSSEKFKVKIRAFINILMCLALFVMSVAALYNNWLIALLGYYFFDQITIIDSKARNSYTSYWYHIVRIICVILIALKLLYVLPFINLIAYLLILRTRFIPVSFVDAIQVLTNFKLVLVSRTRDFLQNYIFAIFLNDNIFFILNLGFRIVMNLSGIHYSVIRNNLIKKSIIKKYLILIRHVPFPMLCIICFSVFFSYSYPSIFLPIFLVLMFFESIANQLNILFLHNAGHKIFQSNAIVVLALLLSIFILVFLKFFNEHFNIFMALICMSILFSINILIANPKIKQT